MKKEMYLTILDYNEGNIKVIKTENYQEIINNLKESETSYMLTETLNLTINEEEK